MHLRHQRRNLVFIWKTVSDKTVGYRKHEWLPGDSDFDGLSTSRCSTEENSSDKRRFFALSNMPTGAIVHLLTSRPHLSASTLLRPGRENVAPSSTREREEDAVMTKPANGYEKWWCFFLISCHQNGTTRYPPQQVSPASKHGKEFFKVALISSAVGREEKKPLTSYSRLP